MGLRAGGEWMEEDDEEEGVAGGEGDGGGVRISGQLITKKT